MYNSPSCTPPLVSGGLMQVSLGPCEQVYIVTASHMMRSPPLFISACVVFIFGGLKNWITVAGVNVQDVSQHLKFYLYTRATGTESKEIVPRRLSPIPSAFGPDKATKVLVHGWLGNQNTLYMSDLRKAYLSERDVNVISVDWSYYTLLGRLVSNPMAEYIAQLLDWLVTQAGVSPGSIHVIGFSLGAQMGGIAGEKMTTGKLGRITGLDPVAFTFGLEAAGRLDSSDAQFVDVIHTSAGSLGYLDPCGHVDFYPNGGAPSQPGCTLDIQGVCSHIRAVQLFLESVFSRKLVARGCNSWDEFTSGQCDSNTEAVMGEYVDQSARGVFYLSTHGSSPFAVSSS